MLLELRLPARLRGHELLVRGLRGACIEVLRVRCHSSKRADSVALARPPEGPARVVRRRCGASARVHQAFPGADCVLWKTRARAPC